MSEFLWEWFTFLPEKFYKELKYRLSRFRERLIISNCKVVHRKYYGWTYGSHSSIKVVCSKCGREDDTFFNELRYFEGDLTKIRLYRS